MPDKNDDKELQRLFLHAGQRFFEFNGNKNTPNIIMELNGNISRLVEQIHEANASSSKLSAILNKLTKYGLFIAGAGVFIGFLNVVFNIYKYING